MKTPSGLRARVLLGCLAVLTVALLPAAETPAQSPYYLYYSFDVPPVMPGFSLSEEGTRQTYTGTLRGSLGGLPLRSATFTYWIGEGRAVGGGTFSLATAAGESRGGAILVSATGEQTTLLFSATYLGKYLEFTLTGAGPLMGGTGVVRQGLALTGFGSHDEYLAAVRRAVSSLPPEVRDSVVAQADTNRALVAEYQQRTASR